MITTAKRLEGIGEYYFSTKLREIDEMNKQGKNVINLGIGSPDLPPHPEVIKILQEESAKPNVHAYQNYKGSPILRKAMSEWYNEWYKVSLNPDSEILPLIGSKEGIMHICMTYLNQGDEVLVPNPGYPTYRSAVKLAGGICVDYDLNEESNWEPNFDALDKIVERSKSRSTVADTSSTGGGREGTIKLMWINYPEMPVGKLPSADLFQKIVAFGKKHDILVCHDNPYSFILNDHPASLLQVPGAKDCVIELNSLSKSHNMAGWRVGMLCGAKERIDEVLRFKSNMDSGMFLPVQLAAAKALSLDKSWYKQVNEIYARRRAKVFELLDFLDCHYDTSQAGMFVWARVPERYERGLAHVRQGSGGLVRRSPGEGGYALSDEVLQNAHVFITPGGIFGNAGNSYVRVSLCSTEEKIEESLARIKAFSLQAKDK